MQDRYVGDIGDLGKLGMLRAISETGLSIGVNWYLTPDEVHNGDGLLVGYLRNEKYRACDEELWQALKRIVDSGNRRVSALESSDILKAVYFSDRLDLTDSSGRAAFREDWHARALKQLGECNVVFVDPDNGLMVPSAEGTVKSNKYVTAREIVDYYNGGASVIYYQHKARRPDTFYVEQHNRLLQRCGGAAGFGLKFVTTSLRYFFFVLQPRHKEIVSDCIGNMLKTPWREHFRTVSGIYNGEGSNVSGVTESRIEKIRAYVDNVLLHMTDTFERRCAYVHLYGVAQACAMIAQKRAENVELAMIAGMLHDLYSYKTSERQDHAHKGAAMAKEILEELGMFTDTETETICGAICKHSDKAEKHAPFVEVLIDADVLQHFLYDPLVPAAEHEQMRLEKLKREFGL